MNNLVKRLRDLNERFIFQGGSEFAKQLADRIETLESEVEEEADRADGYQEYNNQAARRCRNRIAQLEAENIILKRHAEAMYTQLTTFTHAVDPIVLPGTKANRWWPSSEAYRKEFPLIDAALIKPTPPPSRIICDACGPLEAPGKHKSLMCRFFRWLDRNKDKNA
jgi:hypothetical protein